MKKTIEGIVHTRYNHFSEAYYEILNKDSMNELSILSDFEGKKVQIIIKDLKQ